MSETLSMKFTHKHSVFTAPDEHMRIIQLIIMCIQPANKAAEHLIREREREILAIVITVVKAARSHISPRKFNFKMSTAFVRKRISRSIW